MSASASYLTAATSAITRKRIQHGARGTVCVAATQFAVGWDATMNMATAEKLIRDATNQGAHIVLLQELFEAPYFCQFQKQEFFHLAGSAEV